MRMVYTSAPDQMFIPARDRLMWRFDGWARRHRRPVDPVVIEALLDHRWAEGDGLLGRWQPEDFEEALLDWFPRKVTLPPDQWAAVAPTVGAFIDFLFDQDLADRRCADRQLLHAALDKLAAPFADAMADQSRYGLGKFWATRMLHEGVDPADQVAAERFIADLHAGRVAVDRNLLNQVMANHLLGEDPDRHPPLPLVAVPDDDTLRALAAESLVVRRLRELVRWLCDGRTLTTTGRLRLADARELVALLDTGDVLDPMIGDRVFKTRSSDELYVLTVLVAWARAARVVRVVKGRLVPVKSAAKALADPLALSRRAFTGLFELGEAVCGGGWAESVLRWRFDDAVFAVTMALFIAPEPLENDELRRLAYQAACNGLGLDPGSEEQERGWRQLADNDTDRLLDQLARLGAIEKGEAVVALTPLGVGLLAGHLRELGVTVPTIDQLVDETAEVVVATATGSPPETAAALMHTWCARNSANASAELRALAERTDDPEHRKLALAYA
ncbi:hypothetical protein GA0070624_1991 [Micromonospora rhizosphaerae]|uniref:Uncharacterized protein n=1 Tax=Micromonospora rhizosphaerae TaxID=568872 RepID=A0A1C6RTM5_9ACTN|nr:hypothetical protein [Micromonospora rhizosphaerae]SCL20419.1 hypothetical protein GA0070624_1991 [Micromonospora rhizosphaerae]